MEFKLKRFEKLMEITKIANIHYFEFTKKYHTFRDKHAFRELVYVDVGEINVESENYSGTLTNNNLIIHMADETHSLTCAENSSPNVIIIGFECKQEELDALSNTPVVLSDEEKRLLTDIIREGRAVFLPPYDVPNLKDMKKRRDYIFGADRMIKLKLETLLIELVRSIKAAPENSEAETGNSKIHEIHDYVCKNFREHITLDELCFLFNTNKATLCAQFKMNFGDTVVNYINKLRIKEAKHLMRMGDYNLTQISERVGFSSIHYFSRLFKMQEKHSPSEYIKTIKARLEGE